MYKKKSEGGVSTSKVMPAVTIELEGYEEHVLDAVLSFYRNR
jgi:hypothetical protein